VRFVSPAPPAERNREIALKLDEIDTALADLQRRQRVMSESLVSPLTGPDSKEARHVLLVDDSVDTLYVLTRVLQKAGYRTSFAEDGRSAMQRLQGDTPDLVILDVMMPEVDGIELLRWMRSRSQLRQVPVILFTAMDASRVQEDARQLQAAGLFEKGIMNFTQILNAAAQALVRSPLPS
jgi:CheY-like chemotaxis protein